MYKQRFVTSSALWTLDVLATNPKGRGNQKRERKKEFGFFFSEFITAKQKSKRGTIHDTIHTQNEPEV